ncbi:hypothetical protein C6P46_004447 [Rhodotorula mucilaginosa]|uniref:Uncharacterized protein n=1 Tax=Rhodotorula mucilaginosa TaxID=5537 RepID=A0A9P6W2L6_RHOMI|nr:hypothetical protein C6P46_004447 [Rhodotorula mucilaginosa]
MSERREREGEHQLVEDTGWLDLDAAEAPADDFAWRDRELPTIWRNDPLSVPRTSALPRGGVRTVSRPPTRVAVAPGQVDHTAPRAPRDYSDPPEHSRVPVSLAWAIRRAEVAARPGPGPAEGRQEDDSNGEGDSQDEQDSATTRPDGPTIMDQLVRDAASFFATARRSRPPPEASSFSSSSSSESQLRPRARARGGASPPQVHLEQEEEEEEEAVNWTHSAPPPRRRRTREETNAMMGAALRSKKPVYLLYCGNDGSTLIDDDDREEEGGGGPPSDEGRLPTGFRPGAAAAGTRGCGALVCARALLDGVPNMIFRDPSSSSSNPDPESVSESESGPADTAAAAAPPAEERAASSDLPPRADTVADLFEGDGVGERVGRRGWKKCRGGNVLGYRLLRPCVSCSISRPTYTTYASVVTNNDPASRGGEPRGALSAGGVTGGGVVDGLLFHFKLAAVTPVRRRIGIPPAEELPPPRSTWSDTTVATLPSPTTTSEAGAARGGDAAQQQQGGGSGRSRSALPARLREKPARVGDKMTWKHIPTAQRDFMSGLVGEPSDWISPSSETWWLDHAIVKHSRKRSAGAAFTEPNRTFNPDSLSSARTTVDANGGVSRTSPVNSPLRSSLSRSHAIRVRVPLSNPHPASALATSSSSGGNSGGRARQQQGGGNESATASYDRYRNDASDFARRVRQRYADPSASDSAVVTSLERAGYGSGFAAEDEEEDDDRGGAPCSNCAHARGREVVGR